MRDNDDDVVASPFYKSLDFTNERILLCGVVAESYEDILQCPAFSETIYNGLFCNSLNYFMYSYVQKLNNCLSFITKSPCFSWSQMIVGWLLLLYRHCTTHLPRYIQNSYQQQVEYMWLHFALFRIPHEWRRSRPPDRLNNHKTYR